MEKKKLIIFFDSGDTLIDEGTEIRNEKNIVISAGAIPGSVKTLQTLFEKGYRMVLVADGDIQSFQNSLSQNNMYDYFTAIICSELIGEQKPSPCMFKAAMGALNLGEKDCKRIVMVGNNLARDIKGANQMGFTSVFLDWSPRYSKCPKDQLEIPDYIIHTPTELIDLADKIEGKYNETVCR